MELKDFIAGHYKEQYKYHSFSPEKINHTFTWNDASINVLLEEANILLGQLNAYTLIVPNVDLFVQMHITKEANTSSRIEGTQTQMDEALMERESIDPERRDDWEEVQNYIKAMSEAIESLEVLPISKRLIKQTHTQLLSGVRGEKKQPGAFRISQNWIGGSNINNAFYIPPHQDEVEELMSDLESFIHNDTLNVPHLIKLAIIHYQFETIHPFLDGNGRIGRLLITLYLVSNGLLQHPSLYLSDFFERNKGAYYDALTVVRASNDLVHWVKFFLTAVIETSKSSIETFNGILKLKSDIDIKLFDFGKKAQNAQKVVEYLYGHPVINVKICMEILEVSAKTARALLKDFEEKGILVEFTGFQRNQSFVFEEYLELF
ncbi:MAG: MloA [uncultured Sulfurovum sp.]|uniref:MloA n=1 Tax=uncultured Sulfurovum sp. TaxID=269237 RepID=A0A6S6SSX8_9BACT|nr:MAG: MloA [uncultured Sulfurovum sp.]